MAPDTIVIDSFDIPMNSDDVVNKAINNQLAKLGVSAKAVFSITVFKTLTVTWYTIWFKKCKRCKDGCNHHE